jgi:hypothetical protein
MSDIKRAVSVDTHYVTRIKIRLEKHPLTEGCHAFQILRIEAYQDDTEIESLDVSLFILGVQDLTVTKTGGPDNLTDRIIEVKPAKKQTPEELGNSFDKGHAEGPGQ